MGKKNKSGELFDAVARAVETIGIDNTVKALEHAQKTNFKSYKDRISYLITITCEQFGVTKTQLIAERLRDDSLMAMAVIYAILRDKLKYTPTHIAELFGKNISNVSRALLKIDNLNEKLSVDKEIKIRYDNIKQMYDTTFK